MADHNLGAEHDAALAEYRERLRRRGEIMDRMSSAATARIIARAKSRPGELQTWLEQCIVVIGELKIAVAELEARLNACGELTEADLQFLLRVRLHAADLPKVVRRFSSPKETENRGDALE